MLMIPSAVLLLIRQILILLPLSDAFIPTQFNPKPPAFATQRNIIVPLHFPQKILFVKAAVI